MTDLPAFLRGIRSKPDDDVRRLAFADWLDERGDPAWAEFVRLQCEIEPVRGRYDLPGVFAKEKRERELLRANQKRWLAPGDGLPAGDSPLVPRFGFRHGVVEVVRMSVADWLDHGEAVLAAFPTVRELVVFHARGECRELARSDQLRHLDELEIADWIIVVDALALCGSDADGLRGLRLRVGHENDVSVVSTLWEFRNLQRRFRDLRRFELVQLFGGLVSGDQAAELARHADSLAASMNGRVVRPFEQLFPVAEDVGYGIVAGRFRDGTPALVVSPDPWSLHPVRDLRVYRFDETGAFDRWELVNLREPMEPDDQLIHVAADELDFEPGLIAVREFNVPERNTGVQLFGRMDHTLLVNPDLPDGPVRREALEGLVWWLAGGNFVVRAGQNFWADRDGEIHSS